MADNPIVDPHKDRTTVPDPTAARAEALPGPAARVPVLPGDQSALIGNCVARTPHPYTAHELAWRPDPKSHSPSAEKWRQEDAQLRDKPLDVDKDGYHTVAAGDDLSTIAMRSLHDQGKPGGRAAIRAEMTRIVSLNVQAYPGLDKNPDLLRDGDKLQIADCKGHPNVTLPAAGTEQGPPPGGRYGRYGEPAVAQAPPAQPGPPGGRYGRYGEVQTAPAPVAPPAQLAPPGGVYSRYGEVPVAPQTVYAPLPAVVPTFVHRGRGHRQPYQPQPYPTQELPVAQQPVPYQQLPAPVGYPYAPRYNPRVNPLQALAGTAAATLMNGLLGGAAYNPLLGLGYPPNYYGDQGYPYPTTYPYYPPQPQYVYVGGGRRHR